MRPEGLRDQTIVTGRLIIMPLRNRWHNALIICAILAAVWAASADATTLPESYPLNATEAVPPPVDQNLDAWLQEHVNQTSPVELEAAKFEEFLHKQDAATALYLRLLRSNLERQTQRPLVDQVLTLLSGAQDSSGDTILNHPLLPFLYLELLKSNLLIPPEQQRIESQLDQVGAGTCASKQRVYDELSKENLESLTPEHLQNLLARIDGYRSQTFRKNALRRFLTAVPDSRQSLIAERALNMAQAFPAVIRLVPWLQRLAEKSGKLGGPGEPFETFDKVRQFATRRLCSKAKDVLTSALRTPPKSGLKASILEDAVATAKAIDGCYRGREAGLRVEFWKHLAKQMEDTFGIDGWAEAKLRLGFIRWSHNEFAEAKDLFREVLAKSELKSKKLEARAVFALGRIAENEADLNLAREFYSTYLKRFADQENFEEALMALVLIHVDRGEWEEALGPLENLIAQQTALSPDARSTGALSFALFWAGRIYLEKGLLHDAGEHWRRVASEYYSTYYGAMGHYLLEKLTGQRLALQPSRTPPFRMHDLREAFAPVDRQKIRRVEALMRLGLSSEAVCEFEEVDLADGKPEKLLVKALMMHAAGHWLDAIKAYDALPRTFRSTLAQGFERILFPKRYDADVRGLAQKADVDPDLVLAIIRQESVFNPMARSPVGAMGLMQLMPDTAALELKRLPPNYLPHEERRLIHQRLRNPLNLLVAETNLTLGVHHVRSLLQKYKSPVYVLSAYNASPSAAQKWMSTIPTKDVLAFIEKIPYKETRAYVKLVLRNYFYYKRWYGDPKDPLRHLDSVASPLIALAEGGRNASAKAASPPGEAPPASSTNH